jgi:hypothetical protein
VLEKKLADARLPPFLHTKYVQDVERWQIKICAGLLFHYYVFIGFEYQYVIAQQNYHFSSDARTAVNKFDD